MAVPRKPTTHTLNEPWQPLKGARLGWAQFAALTKKNLFIRGRSWKTNLLLIMQAVLFISLTWVVDMAVTASNGRRPAFSRVPTAKPVTVGPIPDCTENMFMRRDKPCYTLLYAPRGNPAVESIMAGVAAGNSIPMGHIRGFDNGSRIDEYLLEHPNTVIAAVEFVVDVPTPGTIGFSVQTNSSVQWFKGKFQDPNMYSLLPTQVAIEKEIFKAVAEQPNVTWEVEVTQFPHPSSKSPSAIANFLPTFVFASLMFQFVLQLHDLLHEKESGSRRLMRVMGLKNAPFWASWISFQFTIAVLESLLLVGFGHAFHFNLFTQNDWRLSFLLILEVALAMSSFGFFVAAFLRKASSAVPVGFFLFVVAWVFLVVLRFGFPYHPKYGTASQIFFSAWPWVLLGKGIDDLAEATSTSLTKGLSWADRAAYCQASIPTPQLQQSLSFWRTNCVMPLSDIFIALAIQTAGFLLLALYFEHVLPDENGNTRPFWFLLQPSFWFPSKRPKVKKAAAALAGLDVDPTDGMDADVKAEQEEMKQRCESYIKRQGTPLDDVDGARKFAVEMYGLRKTYQQRSLLLRKTEFAAVKHNWFGIREGETFCLLGPNGAGKTTTIHCLTGVLPISEGDALVYGTSIGTPAGLDFTRPFMGVCPQFDAGLWDRLSGREHLNLFACIKGIPAVARSSESARLLEDVKLTEAADTTAGAYSGGMKRRLSVAIALSGNPKIVYLDEPTTGLDPISRRHLWDLVDSVKKNRAIILTTHSMEEADILGDRIGIMVRGSLQCVGTSLRLKSRFGSGYRVSVRVQSDSAHAKTTDSCKNGIKSLFMSRLGVKSVDETHEYVHFQVPYENEDKLPLMLAYVKSHAADLGVGDVQLRLTPLEEVFLNVTKRAELKYAEAVGRFEMLQLVEEDITIKVPIGAEFIQSPSGQFYHVQWVQDDSGSLKLKDYRKDDINSKIVPPTNPAPAAPRMRQHRTLS